MSTATSAAAASQSRPVLNKEPSKRDVTANGDSVAVPTLSKRTPRSRAKRQSRVAVEFTNAVSRPSRLSRVTEDPALYEQEQEKNEKRMRKRAFAVQELVESERQYSRTVQFMINVAIPLAQGYPPQPIEDVVTRGAYLPQGKIDSTGLPVFSKEDVNLVFGSSAYKLYDGSCHITGILDKEIAKRGFEKARVGKFLVFAVSCKPILLPPTLLDAAGH
jgi:hypothetical protein